MSDSFGKWRRAVYPWDGPGEEYTENDMRAAWEAGAKVATQSAEERMLALEHAICGGRTVPRTDYLAMCQARDAANARVRELEEALTRTSQLIAANRLMLGEYSGTRHVAEIEDRARAVLGRGKT